MTALALSDLPPPPECTAKRPPVAHLVPSAQKRHLTKHEIVEGIRLIDDYHDLDRLRPRSRRDCVDAPRPCPWVGCRHHLFLDVSPVVGALKFNRLMADPWEMAETCSLDLADREGMTLEQVSEVLGITRERVRQIEEMAVANYRQAAVASELGVDAVHEITRAADEISERVTIP